MATPLASPAWTIRRIDESDPGRLRGFYAALTEDSRESRFHGGMVGLSERAAASFCRPDHEHREGFVAIATGDGETVIGHLCLEPIDDTDLEVAVAVADAAQGHGIGAALLAAGVTWARKHGYVRLTALVRPTNGSMLALLRSVPLPLTLDALDDGEVQAVLDLTAEVPAAA
jgi:GNAT superfamily N-acetyltransferase